MQVEPVAGASGRYRANLATAWDAPRPPERRARDRARAARHAGRARLAAAAPAHLLDAVRLDGGLGADRDRGRAPARRQAHVAAARGRPESGPRRARARRLGGLRREPQGSRVQLQRRARGGTSRGLPAPRGCAGRHAGLPGALLREPRDPARAPVPFLRDGLGGRARRGDPLDPLPGRAAPAGWTHRPALADRAGRHHAAGRRTVSRAAASRSSTRPASTSTCTSSRIPSTTG